MSKRLTDTQKWKKKFFRAMPTPYKLLWNYICDDCDHAGIWHVDMEVARLRIGESVTEEEALKWFEGKVVPFDEGEKWHIPSFVEFQYGSQLVETNKMHQTVIRQLKKYDLLKFGSVELVNIGTTKSALRGRITKKVKDAIFLRDEFICQYCSEQKTREELVIDHFIPLEKGGGNEDDNLITSCVRCNAHKTDLDPLDFVGRPLNFLNITERINSLLTPNNSLQAPYKNLLGAKEKEKDKDKEKDKVKETKGGLGGFEKFWEAYPKKKNKGQAEKAWTSLKPSEQLIVEILQAIERAKTSEEWRKDGGQFIPYPATWIRAKGWEDEAYKPKSRWDDWAKDKPEVSHG